MAGESNVPSHNPCLFIFGQLCTCTEAVIAAYIELFAKLLGCACVPAFLMHDCQAEDLTAKSQSYRE